MTVGLFRKARAQRRWEDDHRTERVLTQIDLVSTRLEAVADEFDKTCRRFERVAEKLDSS